MGASFSTVAVDPSPLKFDSSMASSSSSSSGAAAEPRLPKHDVFLSFRGEDTRNNFTAHLYSALSRKQIGAYIDQVSLKQGSEISQELLKAIEESEISIIIFSKNYASSSWCLDELVHILKCKKEKAQIVLPIFLGIDPSHIRKQEGSYAAAIEKHEKHFKSEKVREWRQALTEAAGLSGWDSRNMSESKILEKVVKRLKRELDTIISKRSDVWNGLVGIPKRLEKIKSYLDSPAVRVGIWGLGGIGKTTLAKAAFDRFYNDFEGSYFAHDVRENAINKGLATLKKEVYSELLGDKKLDTCKTSAVNHRLSRKRILLVLDDVENPMQFEDLVGDPYRFFPGSKIIVTSRHKLKVDEEYKVEELDSNDACKLFYLNAFGHESCRRGFEEISDRVVEYSKGHPLALKVLGASVFYFLESIEDWVKELKKLKRIPNNEIQVSLERSYDALDPEEKGLFLDIACFFKGHRRDIVVGILEDKPIAGLVRKSLITIEDDKIQMHDVIQEMGRNIVLRSTEKLGERSRLWIAKDISFVLENNKGTEAIEGIYLPPSIYKYLHLRPDVFKEMCKLRLLRLPGNVYIDGDLKYLPNGLRYLHWYKYPGKSLPSNFKPEKLVELHMPDSKLEQLWDGVQELGSLKHINLQYSKLLTKIPDLSLAPKLESINLRKCRSLIHIPSLYFQAALDESAYRHQWLRVELGNYEFQAKTTICLKPGFRGYQSYQRIPACVNLDGCKSLTTLPKLSGNIIRLVLSWSALKELPSSIESLENLLRLDLTSCTNLKSLPKLPRNIEVLSLINLGIEQISSSSIETLEKLRLLDLMMCKNLKSLPKLPRNIEVLILDYSGIEQIPSSSIECLCSLRRLSLRHCKSLESLPSNINLKALEILILAESSIQELPSTIENSIGLLSLHLNGCKHLEFVPETLGKLKRLQELFLHDCSKLESFPMLLGVCSLPKLNLNGCNIREIPDRLGSLTSLTELHLRGNIFDRIPASIGMLYKLKKLDISKCKNLQSLPASIGMLYNLKKLDISKCKNLQSLPELPLFIESVNAKYCSSLEMVSSLRSTLTLGRWLDQYDSDRGNDQREFSFLNCTKLGEDAINNIFAEFLYKVFCIATTPPEVVNILHSVVRMQSGDVVVCYPTEEIPRWFTNQYEGSSITITLPPNWYNPKTFLGFVVSIVVVKDEDQNDYKYFINEDGNTRVECKLRLMTNKDRFRDDGFENNTDVTIYLDHIVMWYKYFDHSKANFEKYQEATLEFKSYYGRVKRCGVRMLYLKDAVEESDDGTTATFESWIIDVSDSDTTDDDFQSCGSDLIDSDSDEPPPKRTYSKKIFTRIRELLSDWVFM